MKELTYEIERHKWHLFEICEARWKKTGEVQTEEEHVLYYNRDENGHMLGAVLLVNKFIKTAVMGCQQCDAELCPSI